MSYIKHCRRWLKIKIIAKTAAGEARRYLRVRAERTLSAKRSLRISDRGGRLPLGFLSSKTFPRSSRHSELSQAALPIFFNFKENRVQALHQRIEKQKQVRILNLLIDNVSMTEILKYLNSGVVLTPNVDHLIKLQTDPEFFQIYKSADYKICDSQILLYASRFLGTPIQEKISGSDFFPAFCDFHKNNERIGIFLLGASVGVADKAKQRINSRIGRNIVVGTHSPSWNFENNEQECLEIVEKIKKSQATVLAVGLGAPKQEKWIYKYKDQLPNVKIFLAIGATIDFEAGAVKRSPKWMSNLGIEWLYRLLSEPKRLGKRYILDDMPFFWLILKQKFGLYQTPFFTLPAKKTWQKVLSNFEE